MNKTDQYYGILEAAKILKVTEKTIRNYINKGFLKPEKWNGSWRISHMEISEIFWKKFGKNLTEEKQPEELASVEASRTTTKNQIRIEKSEYAEQQRQLGKLAALEINEKAQRATIQELNERNAQLEASAASGWTEARTLKEELEKLRVELIATRESEMKAREDSAWLRREFDQAQSNSGLQNTLINDLRAQNERLVAQLHERAVGL